MTTPDPAPEPLDELDELGTEVVFGVSTARDLVRGLLGMGVALLCLLCAGGLHWDGWRVVQVLGVVIGGASTWLMTRQRPDAPHNALRRVVRGLGLLFLVAELVELDVPWLDALDLLFQAPFVIAVGMLVFAHVRPGSSLQRRLFTDTALAVVTLTALWSLNSVAGLTEPGWVVRELAYALVVLAAVICGLALGMRLPDTIGGLMPARIPSAWREQVARPDWQLVRDDPQAWVAATQVAGHALRVEIERDPLPPVTRWAVALPAWEALTVRGRMPDDPAAAWSGDEVLDAALWVEGERPDPAGPEHRPLVHAVDAERATWLRVIRSWGGMLRGGELRLELPGTDPTPQWVHARADLPGHEVIERITGDLGRIAASLGDAAPRER